MIFTRFLQNLSTAQPGSLQMQLLVVDNFEDRREEVQRQTRCRRCASRRSRLAKEKWMSDDCNCI